jgi:hypothetical protein
VASSLCITIVTLGSGTNTPKNGGFCLHFRWQLHPGIPCLMSVDFADFADYPGLTFSRIAGNPRQTGSSTAFQLRMLLFYISIILVFHFPTFDSGPKLDHLYSPLLKTHHHGEHLSLLSFPFIFPAAFAIYCGILSLYSLLCG